jgi:ArsR family transcriptional regulator
MEANDSLIDMEILEHFAPIIRAAAHPLRLRILDYLKREGCPRSVSQIISSAGAGQSVVSQQLRILKDMGILNARREGNYVLYDIANPNVLLLLECIRSHEGCR